MNIKPRRELYEEAEEKIKEIVKTMNHLSEEEFINKYQNDNFFHTGFRVLVELFMQAKFDK